MSQAFEILLTAATNWKKRHPECAGGVVLLWEGEVYAWKDSLRGVEHERPGVCAIDDAGGVFIAEGGDEYNGAKC